MKVQKLGGHALRSLAVEFEVDPRSILKEWKKAGSVRGMAGERAKKALREHEKRTRRQRAA